jgi:hypothetical protein
LRVTRSDTAMTAVEGVEGVRWKCVKSNIQIVFLVQVAQSGNSVLVDRPGRGLVVRRRPWLAGTRFTVFGDTNTTPVYEPL